MTKDDTVTNLRIMIKQFCASKLLNRIKEKEKGPSRGNGNSKQIMKSYFLGPD